MRRYLLFDAGCAVCNQLARAIEEAAGGKLEAVSIRERRAVKWLDQVYPAGWEHQPYLVTVDGERVQAYAGPGMALRLGWLLGPRQGWRVWNLGRRYGVVLPPGGEYSAERRGFMKQAAAFVAGLFFFPRFGSAGGPKRVSEVGSPGNVELAPVTGEELKALKDRALRNPDVQQALGMTESKEFAIWAQRIVGSRASVPGGQTQQLLLPLRKRAELALVVYGEVTPEDGQTWTAAVLIDHSDVQVIMQGKTQPVEAEEAARLQRILEHLEQELMNVGSAPQGDCSPCCTTAALTCAICAAGAACLCLGPCEPACAMCIPCWACSYQCGYCNGSGGSCSSSC